MPDSSANSPGSPDSNDAPRRVSRDSGAPLGPGSLTWKYLGDVRGIFLATRAGMLQSMHPAISAALLQHSDFFGNPWNRLLRSAGPILGVVYDYDPTKTGAKVRDFHKSLDGVDAYGHGYHALDPKTFYWAHATFFEAQIATQELFGTPLTRDEKEQLYQESITWYARYGMSMAPVPPDYAAFEAYWDDMIENGIEATKVARISAQKPKRVLPAPYPQLQPIWGAIATELVDGSLFLTRMTLPAKAREKLGLVATDEDWAKLDRFSKAVRLGMRVLPERLRYMPRAARAIARAKKAV